VSRGARSVPTRKYTERADARRRLVAALLLAAALPAPALAHDFRLGALRIDHPYATPTPPGARTGAVYLRGIRNTGDAPDRLVGAATPAARAVEIHRSEVDAMQVMRMREVDGIAVPARGEVRLRHGGEHHLMLIDLARPLKVGDRFPLTLRFERSGEREVTVWVQQPRDAGAAHEHRH
jgi:copper(I)-binding protein